MKEERTISCCFYWVQQFQVFTMPEVSIGLFPNVGASYFLSRLPGHYAFRHDSLEPLEGSHSDPQQSQILQQIREGRMQKLEHCLTREYTICCHALRRTVISDFYYVYVEYIVFI